MDANPIFILYFSLLIFVYVKLLSQPLYFIPQSTQNCPPHQSVRWFSLQILQALRVPINKQNNKHIHVSFYISLQCVYRIHLLLDLLRQFSSDVSHVLSSFHAHQIPHLHFAVLLPILRSQSKCDVCVASVVGCNFVVGLVSDGFF